VLRSAGRLAWPFVTTLLIVYGVLLVATPDYDGGRRSFGAIVLVVAVPIFALYGLALLRLRSRQRR